MEELQQHNAPMSTVADVYLAANEKGSLSDLTGNAEKETGTQTLMFYKNLPKFLDLNVTLGFKNPK